MKSLIKKILRYYNRTITPYNAYYEKLEIIKYDWIKEENIKTVIDIGSNNGGFAKKIRKILPNAKIISFEALEDIYQNLVENFEYDKNFESYNIALSNFNGETSFYRCINNPGSSSLLEMGDLHIDAYPKTSENIEINVKCYKLDDFIQKNKIKLNRNLMIKIDVQGAEKMIFEGCNDLLKNTSIIFTEISFNSLYNNDILANDLINYLYKKGFKLEGIENVSQSLKNGKFLQADMYFKKIKK